MRKKISVLICIVIVLSLSGCGIIGVPINRNVVSSYEGPIFPLEAVEKVDGITIDRYLKMSFPIEEHERLGTANYDFVNDTFYGKPFRFAQVDDQYELTNISSEDITMQMVYPFEANLGSAAERVPVISTYENGPMSSQVILGRTLATDEYIKFPAFDNQRSYEMLMDNGVYLKNSIEAYWNAPSLEESVKVYKLENIGCRTEAQEKMEIEVAIERNADKSQVYTYGFETFGYQINQDILGTSIPLETEADWGKDAYIIVSGDDINISEILCYRTAQKEYYDWEDIEAFELVTYESSLEDVLGELLNDYRSVKSMPECFGDFVTNQVFLDACKQFLVDTEEEREASITSLDYSIFASIEAEYGMKFMLFDITIPANDSVKLCIRYDKPANVVEENKEGYDTYDMILQTVSNLTCETTKIGFVLDDYTQLRLGGPEGDVLKDETYDITSWTDCQIYLESVKK